MPCGAAYLILIWTAAKQCQTLDTDTDVHTHNGNGQQANKVNKNRIRKVSCVCPAHFTKAPMKSRDLIATGEDDG